MAVKLHVRYGADPDAVRSKGKIISFYWPTSAQKRSEIKAVKRGDPATYEAIYQCRPGSREGTIFLESDFAYYTAPETLSQGVKDQLVQAFIKRGHSVVQAWDTAFEETKQSAWSVCITALLVPCNHYHLDEDPAVWGQCDAHFDVLILDVYREKVDFGDLLMNVRAQSVKWQPEFIVVENRASGISAIQVMRKAGYPIHAVPAAEGKRARAISGVGAGSAQGWFRRHRVLFPTTAPWLETLTTEMKDFSGLDDAISDQTDAMVHLVRYAILAGSSVTLLPTDWSPERGTPVEGEFGLGHNGGPPLDGVGMFLTYFNDLESMSVDPFDGLCGRCDHYGKKEKGVCAVHNMRRATLDTCGYYVAGAAAA